MRVKTAIRATFVLLLLSLLAACGGGASGGGGGGGGGGSEQVATGVVTVAGQVTGSGGLAEVLVSAGGKSTTTDDNGYYQVTEIPVPADGRLIITYEKDGYATYQRSLDVSGGNTYVANAKLLQYQASGQVDGTAGGSLDDGNGNEVNFPAGAFSGTATVNMAVGDPSTEEGRAVFPGDYMATDIDDDGPNTPLESVVFTEVTLLDADGNEITQLDAPATVRLRLPDDLQSQYSAGDTIPWWSYDEENATWVREDADPSTPEIDDATVVVGDDDDLYVVAQVTHFTWWNADKPIDEHACLCLTVTDGDGNPLVGVQVIAEGVTYNGRSTPRATDAQGYVCLTVKRSTNTQTEQVKIFVEQGGVRFYYRDDSGSDIIDTPTQQGSTIDDSGECVGLDGGIVVDFDGTISGTVTRGGEPWAGFTFFTDFGRAVTTDDNGNYSVESPSGTTVTLFYPGWFEESVSVPQGGDATHDIDLPNRDPVIDRIERNPSTRVANGATVNFTAFAMDPDGDPLTYDWDVDVGNLTANGINAQWQAPASGDGVATITFVASDPFGGQASKTVEVSYGTLAADTLRLRILDNPIDRTPLVNAPVVVYGNTNMEDSTNEDGWVEFTGVPNPVTFTAGWDLAQLYEEGVQPRIQQTSASVGLQTFVEVPTGEYVIYAESIPGFLFDGELSDFSCDAPIVMNVRVNVPAGQGITGVSLLPFDEDYPAAGGLEQIDICPYHLQNDGKVSFLAVGVDADGRLVAYGFQRDVTPVPGGTVTVDLEREPKAFTWTEVGGPAPQMIGVMARYKGVYYYGGLPDSDPSTQDVGENALPDAFPFDTYWFESGNMDPVFMSSFLGLDGFGEADGPIDEVDIQSRRFTSAPDNVVFDVPDFGLDGSYDPDTQVLNIRDTTAGDADAVSLRLIAQAFLQGSGDLMVDWGFFVPGNREALGLSSLTPPSDLVDSQQWDDFLNALGQFFNPFASDPSDAAFGVSLLLGWESDAFDGLADYWQYVAQGRADYPSNANYFDIGLKVTPIGESVFDGLPF